MNALVIGDKEYGLPENLSIKKWMEAQKQPLNIDYKIAIVMGIPFNEVDLIPEKTKGLLNSLISVILHPVYVKLNRKLGGRELLDVNKLTLGNFIDLEVYIGEGYNKHLDKMVQVLYQTDNIDDLTINDVWGGIEYYLKWRISLYSQYKNLFNVGVMEDEAVEIQNNNAVKKAHIWYDIVMILADNKFLNMDAVLNKGVVECLNWLAWNKDQKKKEAEHLKNIK